MVGKRQARNKVPILYLLFTNAAINGDCQMTIDEEKKFRLYPRKEDYQDGEWDLHNEDPFFEFWYPEDFARLLTTELEGMQREIRGRKIDFIKCIHCEEEYWQIMHQQHGILDADPRLCDCEHKRMIKKI